MAIRIVGSWYHSGGQTMNPNVLIAAISAAGSIAIAITALLLNYRAFASIERRLEIIEGDLKEFFRQLVLARH
jgi:hypothetical protein